jgi:hypothetical protein
MVGGISLRVASMLAVSFSAFPLGPFGLCIFWCRYGGDVRGGGGQVQLVGVECGWETGLSQCPVMRTEGFQSFIRRNKRARQG